MDTEYDISFYIIFGLAFFIFIFIRQYNWGGFVPSMEEEEKTTEESLKDIYSRRSNEELEAIISNESAAEEAKIIAHELLDERTKT